VQAGYGKNLLSHSRSFKVIGNDTIRLIA